MAAIDSTTMELEKISYRNTWQEVSDTTCGVRDGSLEPALGDWLTERGVALDTSLFPSVRQCDERLYMGTLVDGHGRVLEFLADLDDHDLDAGLEDVTANLGRKCPSHALCDPRDRITMALMIHRGSAPPLADHPQSVEV